MNVLLLTVDSLRADRILSDDCPTPRLDELIDDEVQFTQAITHGHGTPVAFPAILTGTYPMLYGGCTQLSAERPILARKLHEEGYDTAAFTSNPHLFDKYGYGVGFDTFNEYRSDEGGDEHHSPLERVRLAVQPYLDSDSRLYDLARRMYYFLLTTTNERPYAPADEINDHVIEWLDSREGDDPFFSWVHYMDPHYPFYQDEETLAAVGVDPISNSEQRRLNRLMNEEPESLTDADIDLLTDLYDAEVYFTDQQLGRLFDALRERGLYDDTLVIVTSDHGEAFGEHDGFGHYKALYEELVRVPLVMQIPDQESATVHTQTGHADLAPTILDYLGIDHSLAFSGDSLRTLIEGQSSEHGRHVVGHGDPLGVRTEEWKYIWWDRDGDEPLDAELFDLQTDPAETTDVGDEHPDVVEEFDEYLASHVRHAEETGGALDDSEGAADAEGEIAEQLEALGYK
jgi:arylsulfatase A-like enzyme